MRLVADASILFGALMRDGATRRLILKDGLDLKVPQWVWDEVERNRSMLLAKSRMTAEEFDRLVGMLRRLLYDVPASVTQIRLQEALRLLRPDDAFDAPYLATALALESDVWTHDKPLTRAANAAGIGTWSTRDLLAHLSEA